MSYVADKNDIKEKLEEFWIASENLECDLDSASINADFNNEQQAQIRYVKAQLKADRFRIEKELKLVLTSQTKGDN